MTRHGEGPLNTTAMLRVVVPVLDRIENPKDHVQGIVFQVEVHDLTDERETVALHTPRGSKPA